MNFAGGAFFDENYFPGVPSRLVGVGTIDTDTEDLDGLGGEDAAGTGIGVAIGEQ